MEKIELIEKANRLFNKYYDPEFEKYQTFDIESKRLYSALCDELRKQLPQLRPKNTIIVNQSTMFENEQINTFIQQIIVKFNIVPSPVGCITGTGFSGTHNAQLLYSAYPLYYQGFLFVKTSEPDFRAFFIHKVNKIIQG